LKERAFVDVRAQNAVFIDTLAELSYHAFRGHAPNWLPTIDAARDEVTESLEAGRHSRALVDTAQEPVGWVGVIPHSGGRVWEIHPIAVSGGCWGLRRGVPLPSAGPNASYRLPPGYNSMDPAVSVSAMRMPRRARQVTHRRKSMRGEMMPVGLANESGLCCGASTTICGSRAQRDSRHRKAPPAAARC
jgi:hypothetical protein